MDDHQALAIVSALANGAHPQTGELFPADSPYQAPDVIRALFAAQRALEAQSQTGRRAPSSTQVSTQPSAQSIQAVQSAQLNQPRKPASANAGKTWSAEEDRQLLAAFDAAKPIAEIARAHSRTEGGVRARLEKHGRLEPSTNTRWSQSRGKEAAQGSQRV